MTDPHTPACPCSLCSQARSFGNGYSAVDQSPRIQLQEHVTPPRTWTPQQVRFLETANNQLAARNKVLEAALADAINYLSPRVSPYPSSKGKQLLTRLCPLLIRKE